jgi:aldehyde:ferredoxin oxidoreductase
MDCPPARWFEESLTKGVLKGKKLNRQRYNEMLQTYYRKRGWDKRGVPTRSTLKNLGLEKVVGQLGKRVKLSE